MQYGQYVIVYILLFLGRRVVIKGQKPVEIGSDDRLLLLLVSLLLISLFLLVNLFLLVSLFLLISLLLHVSILPHVSILLHVSILCNRSPPLLLQCQQSYLHWHLPLNRVGITTEV